MMISPEGFTCSLRLTPAEALVLFEFLDRHGKHGELEVCHAAEDRVLRLLHGQLNGRLPDPFSSDYGTLVAAARKELQAYSEVDER